MTVTVGIVTSRVLLVTDDQDLVRLTEATLGVYPVALRVVRSRRELALEIARGSPFSLVVSEVVMTWVTGVEVLRACDARTTPVVFVAAEGSPFSPEQVDQLGDDVALVRRPFQPDHFARTLAASLRRSLVR